MDGFLYWPCPEEPALKTMALKLELVLRELVLLELPEPAPAGGCRVRAVSTAKHSSCDCHTM